MEMGPAESCESFGREVALMFDKLSSARPGDFLCFSWLNEMMEAFTVADVSFRIILDEYKSEFMKCPLDIMFANYLRCCDEGHRLSFSIIREDSFPLIEDKIKMLHCVEDDVKGVSNLGKGIHDQMMKGADYAADQSRYRSASLSLEYIQNLIIRPTSQEILASNGLVRGVFTMECVSYIALWLLVGALPCYGRRLEPSFEFPREYDLDNYPWAISFTRVKQRVLELRSDDGLVQEYSKMKQSALELHSLNAEQKQSVAAEFCIAARNLRTAFGPFKLHVEDFHSRLKKWCNEYKEILDTAPTMNPSAGAPVPSSSPSNLCAELESVVCALFASLSSEELMSVDWVTKVQDIFAACMKHLLLIISLNQHQCSEFPIDKVFDKYFENCVAPALAIMKASLQGITKIRDCLKLSDIVVTALSGNSLQLLRASRALEKLSSVMNNQSETNASKTLQSIADSLITPRKREFPRNIELANTFYTMRFVSLSVMLALVAAVPCPGRGLMIRVKFPDEKDFPWAEHMSILHQRIIEADNRSNSAGLRLGLLKETKHWETCMLDVQASIDDSASGLSEELKARISDQVAVLNSTTNTLNNVLDNLEEQLRSIFREATSFVQQGRNILRTTLVYY